MNIYNFMYMIRDPELPAYENEQMAIPESPRIPVEGTRVEYAWDALEYLNHEKSKNWYLFMGILGVALILYGIFSGSLFMSVAVAIFMWIYWTIYTKEGEIQKKRTTLTDMGIIYDEKFFSYGSLEKFYIILDPAFASLHLTFRKRFTQDFVIYLEGSEDRERIRALLSKHLQEIKGVRESLLHRITRLLKL